MVNMGNDRKVSDFTLIRHGVSCVSFGKGGLKRASRGFSWFRRSPYRDCDSMIEYYTPNTGPL